MQDIQEIWNRLEEKKQERKELKKMMRNIYMEDEGYQNLFAERQQINAKMKSIRVVIDQNYTDIITKIQDLTIDIDSDKELLTDITTSRVMKGESVVVVDKYEQECFPLFSASFVPQK